MHNLFPTTYFFYTFSHELVWLKLSRKKKQRGFLKKCISGQKINAVNLHSEIFEVETEKVRLKTMNLKKIWTLKMGIKSFSFARIILMGDKINESYN